MSTSTFTEDQVTESVVPLTEATPSHQVGPRNPGKHIAGTYLLREPVQDDDRIFLRLVTVMADGTWLSSHARQHSMEFGFTNQQGVWQTTGPQEIRANVIDFNYNPAGGDPTSVSRIEFNMQFSEDLHEVRGKMYGERYHLDQNPMNPEETPFATFGNTFTGRRVVADK